MVLFMCACRIGIVDIDKLVCETVAEQTCMKLGACSGFDGRPDDLGQSKRCNTGQNLARLHGSATARRQTGRIDAVDIAGPTVFLNSAFSAANRTYDIEAIRIRIELAQKNGFRRTGSGAGVELPQAVRAQDEIRKRGARARENPIGINSR